MKYLVMVLVVAATVAGGFDTSEAEAKGKKGGGLPGVILPEFGGGGQVSLEDEFMRYVLWPCVAERLQKLVPADEVEPLFDETYQKLNLKTDGFKIEFEGKTYDIFKAVTKPTKRYERLQNYQVLREEGFSMAKIGEPGTSLGWRCGSIAHKFLSMMD